MNSQRGILLVAVLACLVIVTSLAMTGLTATLRMHRSIDAKFQLRQTQLLIDSAVRRATAVLRADTDYRGETWQPVLPDESVHARVVIDVQEETMTVTATLVSTTGFQTQRSDTIPF